MNISNWSMAKIMMLPDWLFGPRFLVSVYVYAGGGGVNWGMSSIAFPERAVIWACDSWPHRAQYQAEGIRLAFGDVVPTSNAQMMLLEPVFSGFGIDGQDPRVIPTYGVMSITLRNLRTPVKAAGRKLVMEVDAVAGLEIGLQMVLTVSGVPSEVPEWLLSDRDKGPM